MKVPRVPHPWTVSPRRAIAIQRHWAQRVQLTAPDRPLRWIAGVDCAFSKDGSRCLAAAVLWDRQDQKVIEQQVASRVVRFPYVPGLLSFREAPAILAALRRLQQEPDAILCDGQGLAHPRHFGLACHLGVLLGLPSVGCAKSRLVGDYREPSELRGSKALLEYQGQIVGAVLRTRTRVKAVFISVGHLLDLATAEQLVLDCAVAYRLPEPTRLADRLVAAVKRGNQ